MNRDLLIRAKQNENYKMKTGKSSNGGSQEQSTHNAKDSKNEEESAKTLLMLKLLSNQYKNTAMLKRGNKPLTLQDRDKIELEQQFMAGQKFF